MKLKKIINDNLCENMQMIKFKYDNFKQDPRPRVKVLDFEYKGQKHQKNYGERKDVLGFNINYFKNHRYAIKAIDRMDDESRKLSNNKEEKYRRIESYYPEAIKFLRRYNKEYIRKLKMKSGIFYRKSNYDKLIELDK